MIPLSDCIHSFMVSLIIQMRIEQAENAFFVAIRPDDGAIVGFTCGTQTASSVLTHESMSTHDPEGTLLCIHSVVIEEGRRRKGVATKMLRAYLRSDLIYHGRSELIHGSIPDIILCCSS